ncbi:MAG: glycoside hydrolase family 25 protein [Oscillospiraceae bacterium]|nr:glycoside hydrolase family 25 protein [Oscillospiraceae bacterium]
MTKKKLITLICVCVVFAGLVGGVVYMLLQKPQDTPTPTDTTQTTVPETTTAPTTVPVETAPPALEFAYEGDYLTCTTAPSVLGIDVSTFQKQINWKKVKKAGVEFVMIRLGYRGFVEGVLFEDEWAQKHYKGAKEAGLKVGGYFFSQAISQEEAKEEAEYCLQIIKGWEVEMPIVFDWEFVKDGYRTDVVTARMLTDCTKMFCHTIEQAGYQSMVYFNPTQSRKKMHMDELTDYGFWLAMYDEDIDYEYRVDMWQYTNKGKVPGVKGNVDIDLYFPREEIS